MKNILSFLLIAAGIIFTLSCKDQKTNTDDSDVVAASQEGVPEDRLKSTKRVVGEVNNAIDSDSQLVLIKNMTRIRPEEVANMKKDAEVIINHRYKETEKKSYIILDKDLWEYEFIFLGKKMSEINQFAGCWIDFSEDMTYTYGSYEKQLGSGIYTYNLDTGLLLLIDDASNIKPQEFEAKLFDKTLVMDGNDIYKDNNYNAKLKRITERPSR